MYGNGLGGMFVMLALLAAAIGAGALLLLQWLWPIVKAMLHAWTA